MKKIWYFILLFSFPIQVFAYSTHLVVGGEPIGIEVHSNGVYVVDFYKVSNRYIGKESGFLRGDIIKEINHKPITNIQELNREINEKGTYSVIVDRNGKTKELTLTATSNEDKIETGLYVKDMINGLGTLSYIDPESKIFASLGHEILESTSQNKFQIRNGYIYDVELNYIHKSSNGNIGELHANFLNQVRGSIHKNEVNGIYGKYTGPMDNLEQKDIATFHDIHLGEAYIRFQLEEEPLLYSINIIHIDEKEEVKNIFFEITDQRLLEKTGGIVQGMSGSPILQDNKIIGVVNYVVINDSKKGYGIFIEKMLEEGDKLLNS